MAWLFWFLFCGLGISAVTMLFYDERESKRDAIIAFLLTSAVAALFTALFLSVR